MQNFYPIFAILSAIAALLIGGAELIVLGIKPAAILTWIGGWALAMSLTFSSTWPSPFAYGFALTLSILYVLFAYKIWLRRHRLEHKK